MLRSIRLLVRTFTPVEIAVLDAVVAALPEAASLTCKQQVAAVTKVQRLLDWTEINFYRIANGKPDWSGISLFDDRREFKLSESTYVICGHTFTTQIICIAGHIFSFVTRPSIKRFCFGAPSHLQTTILTDPQQKSFKSHDLPKTFRDWHASTEPESNRWSALHSADTYSIHLPDADYIVLAVRGDEVLLSQVDDKTEAIYYASTIDPARKVGQSFAVAMAET